MDNKFLLDKALQHEYVFSNENPEVDDFASQTECMRRTSEHDLFVYNEILKKQKQKIKIKELKKKCKKKDKELKKTKDKLKKANHQLEKLKSNLTSKSLSPFCQNAVCADCKKIGSGCDGE